MLAPLETEAPTHCQKILKLHLTKLDGCPIGGSPPCNEAIRSGLTGLCLSKMSGSV